MPADMSDIFVGRQSETARLSAAVEELASDRGRVIMLTGEPGIGKTTLAERLVSQASNSGCLVLRGVCSDGGYTPPFWLWTQAIRCALESSSFDDAVNRLSESQRLAIARIVPELDIPKAHEESVEQSEDDGRFTLYDSVTRLLVHLSRATSTVIWLDDLHWADDADLALLEFASQQLTSSPTLILGTYRDTDVTRDSPLVRTLGTLTRMRGYERIQITGLATSEMGELIERFVPVPLGASQSAQLVERAAGNPLFGREMARGVSSSGGPEIGAGASFRLPESIAEAIGRRMDFLEDGQLDVLRTAAVFGPDFHVDDLMESMTNVGDITEPTLLAAQQRGLVEELPSSPGTYRFTHALVRQTLHDGLTPTQLVQAHARIGTALVQRHDAADHEWLPAIAMHHREGVLLLDLDDTVSLAIGAANHALATYSFSEAADHFDWVARSMSDQKDSPERAFVLHRLGIATLEGNLFDRQPGWDALSEAVSMYVRLGMNDDAVAAASYPAIIGGMTGVVEVIEERLHVASPGTVARGWLLARYVVSLADAARYDEAESAFRETLEIAAEHEDERLMARALVHGAQARYRANDPELCASRGMEAIELAIKVNEPLSVLRVLDFCIESLCATSRTRDALTLIDRCRDVEYKSANTYPHLARAEYVLAMNTGNWNGISSITNELPDGERKADLNYWLAVLNGLRLGKPETSLYQNLNPSFSKWVFDGYHIAVDIVSTWLQVHPDQILLQVCERVLCSSYIEPGPTAEGDTRRHGLAVLLSLVRGEPPEPQQIAAIRASRSWILPRTTVPIDRVLGLVSAAAGEYVAAREHIDKAIEFCRDAQFRPSLAWSLFDLIRLAGLNPASVKPDEVADAAKEALLVCEECEMPALALLIQEAVEPMSSSQPVDQGFPGGLSGREVEVLRHMATGSSNQEIADALFISRYTVVRHVSNIFQKTGSANRTEATAYAHHHALL